MKKILLMLLVLGTTCTARAQDITFKESNTFNQETIPSRDTVNTAEKKLLSEIKAALQHEGNTQIGTFKIGTHAIIFPHNVSVRQFQDLVYLKDSIDNKNKELLKDSSHQRVESGKITYRHIITPPKTLWNLFGLFRCKNDTVKETTDSAIVRVGYIDSIRVVIAEGLIEHLMVYMQNGSRYYNTKAPIQLLNLESRFGDHLYNSMDGSYILLKDAISFDPERRFNYFPNDDEIVFRQDSVNHNNTPLYAKDGVHSFVNLQVYSDLLALLGDQANGLVQVEADSRFYIHRRNIRNRFMYILYAVEPYFQFNKLDSKFDTVVIDPQAALNRMELFRRATFSTGVTIPVFRYDWRPANSLIIKAGYMYSSSRIFINEVKTNATFHTQFVEAQYKSKRLNNFGIDFSGRFMFQNLNKNEEFTESGYRTLLSLGSSVYFYPSSKNEKSKIFVRFINYLSLKDRRQDFFQLQAGISQPLDF